MDINSLDELINKYTKLKNEYLHLQYHQQGGACKCKHKFVLINDNPPHAPTPIIKIEPNPLSIIKTDGILITDFKNTQLGEYTSDHTHQAIKIQQGSIILSGFTWNLLNKGHDKIHCNGCDFTNNPFNVNEEFESYKIRKNKQITEIKIMLQDPTNNYDFALFQEVDFIIAHQEPRNKEINDQFFNMLKECGWLGISTTHIDRTKPMMTIFNKLTLNHKGKKTLFNINGRNGGFENTFTVKNNGQNVNIVNLHLNFDYNYYNVIFDYQMKCVSENTIGILGGDNNRPQGDNVYGMIGNWEYPTNFDVSSNILTKYHTVNDIITDLIKRYDGFFINPSGTNSIKITELPSKYFNITDSVFEVKDLNPDTEYSKYFVHDSRIGYPWVKNSKFDDVLKNHMIRIST